MPTAAGHPCSASISRVVIRGKRYQLKTCMMHAAPAIRKAMGIEPGYKPNCGKKRRPHPTEILRARFEEDADRYLKPLEDALIAMRAVVVGNGGSAHLEEFPDFALRLAALEKMLDRIYGRPKQAMELTGADGNALEVLVPNDEARREALAQVLASTGALRTAIPANASASAPTTN